jgi:DNA-binding MarR family transcriptional regulator
MPSRLPRRQDAVSHTADTRTPAGDALSELWVGVFQLNGLFTAAGDALARPSGQTSARWQVMAAIEAAPASVAQIARRLRLARQSVQRVADILERDGIATYVDNPAHRRAKLLALTERGREILASIQTAQRAWANDLGAAVGERNLRSASAVLGRVVTQLEPQRRRPRS